MKRLLIKILPSFLVNFIIKSKYKFINYKAHTENIKKGNLTKVVLE